MLEYRVQCCIDKLTYEALQKFMTDKDIEKTSTALRKILRAFLMESYYVGEQED